MIIYCLDVILSQFLMFISHIILKNWRNFLSVDKATEKGRINYIPPSKTKTIYSNLRLLINLTML